MDKETSVPPVIKTSIGTFYDFYVTGVLMESTNYVEWVDILRNSTENDIVKLHINCYGGDLFTAIQLLRAMEESPAHIIASIEGACISAATLLFINADSFEITENSAIMFHNYSGGAFGKGNEMHAQIDFERRWSEKLFRSKFKHFLTESEITRIIKGEDLWMDSEEVELRCQIMLEEREKERKQSTLD